VLRELLEPGDLALALAPHRIVFGEALDQPTNPIANLEREVRSGGTGEGPDVLDRHRPAEAVGPLGLAHGFPFGRGGGASCSGLPGRAAPPLTAVWPPARAPI
jgi:hypothetical protein